jgi:multicomponent Na+:H+ antiporter subunit F
LDFLTLVAIVVGLALVLPLYRVLRGPTVYDRMVGVNVAGTKTIILICLVGFVYGRIDMFLDIAIAYAMLNFVGGLVVAKYLDRAATGRR